jgi:DNA segregation ATPase FtsK/SpoIIIE-like protein
MEKDDLYDEAARIVVSSGQASISYLQRRLRIGFSRAARLVDMMEMDGLVSPGAGGKAREVLVDKGTSRKSMRSSGRSFVSAVFLFALAAAGG